jgi:nickel/cobalt transporter (NicO) family protein
MPAVALCCGPSRPATGAKIGAGIQRPNKMDRRLRGGDIVKVLVALLLLFLTATPLLAQTNPFTGAPAPERTTPAAPANPFTGAPAPAPQAAPQPPSSQPTAEPSWWAQLNREIARFQRDTTREMSLRMREIRDGETTAPLLIGIALAFAYGVIHAAGPGHGKVVVVGYFLTRRARIGRGLLMGLQISLGHVVSAIIIALVADLIFRTVWGTSAAEIRMVQLASYALIALIGLYMLVETVRGGGHRHHHCDLDHAHAGHDHAGHDHGPSHGGHAHGAPSLSGPGPAGHAHEHRPQSWLSLGVGMVPCTGAILVMLYAIANGILLAGFILVAAIAAGMTVTMAALGILAIVARGLMTRWAAHGPDEEGGWLGKALEYAGAAAITLIGVLLFLGAY